MFLYWNTVKIDRRGKFIEVNARGTELFLNDNNEFVDRAGTTSLAAHAYDVVLSGPVNGSAEIYDITVGSDGQTYALATISESGCTHPGAPFSNCYRLSVVSSSSPLMERHATVNHLSHGIPLHSHEYSRFSWLNGRTTISLQFVKNDSNSENQPSLVGQYRSYLLDSGNIFPEKKRTTSIRRLADLNVPEVVTPVSLPTPAPTPPPVTSPGVPPQSTDYASIVRSIYLEVLQRPADSAGLNFYVSLMQQGTSATVVRNDLLKSPEYKERIQYPAVVRRLYREVLRREADPGGLALYVSYMMQGQSESTIRQHLLSSKEYKNLR